MCIRSYCFKPDANAEYAGKHHTFFPSSSFHFLFLSRHLKSWYWALKKKPINLYRSRYVCPPPPQTWLDSRVFPFLSLQLNVESYPICRQPLALLLSQGDDEYISISSLWLRLQGPVQRARISYCISREIHHTQAFLQHIHTLITFTSLHGCKWWE